MQVRDERGEKSQRQNERRSTVRDNFTLYAFSFNRDGHWTYPSVRYSWMLSSVSKRNRRFQLPIRNKRKTNRIERNVGESTMDAIFLYFHFLIFSDTSFVCSLVFIYPSHTRSLSLPSRMHRGLVHVPSTERTGTTLHRIHLSDAFVYCLQQK